MSGFASAAFSLENNPVVIGLQSFGGKLGGIASGVAGKAKAVLGPIGDAFGGIAGVVGPRLQSGLNAVGGLIASFFSPGNFIKLLASAPSSPHWSRDSACSTRACRGSCSP